MLGVKVNEIEENTWVESISIWANNLLIDGISLNELYPDCVEVIKGSYRDQNKRIDLELETFSLDLCILSKSSVQV